MHTSVGSLLEIKDLNMAYPSSHDLILDRLTLRIEPGEKLALVGASGCGKSTIAKVILQLLPEGSLCSGELLLAGKDPRILDPSSLRRLRGESVGLVFQDPMTRLNPLMTIGHHLEDTLKAHRPQKGSSWIRRKAEELLVKVGINPDRFDAFPHEFSGGMRQRIAIALAIALNPPLVIADEPTTSLDVAVADQVMHELTKLCSEMGSALLLITHDLALTSRWCKRVAILDQGRLVEDAPMEHFLKQPQSDVGRILLNSAREKVERTLSSDLKTDLVLEVNRLRCWYPLSDLPWKQTWQKAVDEISFALSPGETLGVVGPSGCGKSTLCRALMGLIPIRGGEVKLDGQNLFHLKGKFLRKARQSIQMVFQDPFASLNPQMTVCEAIADPLILHQISNRVGARAKARELLEQVGLTPPELYQDRLPAQLSGGQQQRVAIARALALKPKVLICDESVSMLDAQIQHEILNLLKSLQDHLNVAILFITHDLSIAARFCHRVFVLENGKIVEEGASDDLFNSPQEKITQKLVAVTPQLPI